MSQLGAPTAFNPDSGQTTGLNVKKKKKRLRPDQAGPPAADAPRPRFNELRQSQLERQGVDVDELKDTNRTGRARLAASKQSRVDGGRLVRQLESSGDLAGANALRAELRGQRLGEDEAAQQIGQRSSLLRGRLSDLPQTQQTQVREQGRSRLNAQLPAIAGGAALAARTAEDAEQAQLAEIGAKVFELQSGSQSAEGLNSFELARLAQEASPEVINRVTNGVGLPRTRSGGLRDFAERTSELSESGIDFGPNQNRTSQLDPDLIERIRAEQETESIRNEAVGRLERDAIEQGTIASENITGGLRRDGAVLNAERAAAELNEAGSAASQQTIPLRQQVEEAQARQAIETLGGNVNASQSFGQAISQLDPAAAIDVVSGAAVAALKGVPNAKNHQEAAPMAEEFASTVATIFADPTLTPDQAKSIASEMLKQIEESGIDPSRVSAPLKSTSLLARASDLSPFKTSGGPTLLPSDYRAIEAVNDNIQRAIRTLQEIAGQSSGS